MRTLLVLLIVIGVVAFYAEGSPFHKKEISKKESIKIKVADAAIKSKIALKAKGVAALAVAKAPLHLAKKVAAGIIAKKAIVVSKVSAAAAAVKAATAVKAAVIAKKALGIKLKPKIDLLAHKKDHHAPSHFIKKGTELVEHGLHAIKSQIIAAKPATVVVNKPIVHKVETIPIKPILYKKDPHVATLGY